MSAQTAPMQYPPTVQPRIQQQPIQAQPMQTPPFGTPGTPSVYQPQPTAQPAAPHGQMGANMPPVRVATNNTAVPPATGQPISLYNPNDPKQMPLIVQPGAGQAPPPSMPHMGRAEPANRIVPFFLNPQEQQELDVFLARWEKYSAAIKRYDVDFNMFEYDPTIPGAVPNQPWRITFGYFKYIATPMRFAFVIEGEWRDVKGKSEKIKRDEKNNQHIYAEKTIIDDKAVYKFDYNSKTMVQINVPPEMVGKGIADSPLPLIFGAKADDLKRRFSMKVVTDPNGTIRLYARPRLIEDQQDFKELEILLEKDLRAKGLRQLDINGKGYKSYELTSTKINDRLGGILDDIRLFFTPTVPPGWKHEVNHWAIQPSPAPAMSQVPVANPYSQPPSRSEVPLYRGP